jgi:hypothetical protein
MDNTDIILGYVYRPSELPNIKLGKLSVVDKFIKVVLNSLEHLKMIMLHSAFIFWCICMYKYLGSF